MIDLLLQRYKENRCKTSLLRFYLRIILNVKMLRFWKTAFSRCYAVTQLRSFIYRRRSSSTSEASRTRASFSNGYLYYIIYIIYYIYNINYFFLPKVTAQLHLMQLRNCVTACKTIGLEYLTCYTEKVVSIPKNVDSVPEKVDFFPVSHAVSRKSESTQSGPA